MQHPTHTCGIDVSSKALEVCILQPEGDPIRYTAQNTVHGIRRLIPWLKAQGVQRVVMEATGGYELEARDRLRKVGFQVSVGNPARIRSYARGVGTPAKTDRIDAEMIARFACAVSQRNDGGASEKEVELKELGKRLRQLKEMHQGEKNRRRFAGRSVRESIDRQLRHLGKEIERVEKRIRALVESEETMMKKVELLTQHKGVGFLTAVGLLTTLPELGKVNRKEIAALAGVAPYTRESGKWKGKSFVSGGREWARRYLYMAALVASRHNEDLREFYERLLDKGKPKKLALTAVMRKLIVHCNATLKYA